MNIDEWSEKFENENRITTWQYGIFQSLIEKHSIDKNDLTLVEIGVARGGHVRHLLDTFSSHIKKIYGIDPYISGYDDKDVRSRLSEEEQEWLYTWVNNYCKDDKFRLIRSTSEYVVPFFDDETIDAIYIDGAHTFEGVTTDIQAWLPKVKTGGILVGDDFNWSSVEKAVRDLLPGVLSIGNTWYYLKNENEV